MTDRWTAYYARLRRDRIAYEATTQTLAEAVELLAAPPRICACVGLPACCSFSYANARQLVRRAHIAVKLIEDWRKVKTNG